jgi:prepilin-type N-terminal cleavage/methylation domain-containing protein
MKKMNNKGFSLVELIVVVLIMAIIAVALAPQVMKWVENSRKSNDIEHYNALITAANVACTDENVITALKNNSNAGSVKMDKKGGTSQILPADLATAMEKTLPGCSSKVCESEWAGSAKQPPFTFTISLTPDGAYVNRTNEPVKDFS